MHAELRGIEEDVPFAPDERTLARPRLRALADIEALEVARRLKAEEDQRPRSGA
jgi:hypothetical protein